MRMKVSLVKDLRLDESKLPKISRALFVLLILASILYYTLLYSTLLYSTILYTIYYILYTIYYILYTIYYILYTIYYILYTIYYILYTIYYILYYTILYYRHLHSCGQLPELGASGFNS